MGLGEQRMWRQIVPTSQCPVERLGTRAEVHELDHGMREKQRGHHPGGQLIRIVRLGHHEYDDEQVLRVDDQRGDPAVHLPEQHGHGGIIVVVLGYEQAGHLYQPDVRPQVLDEAVLFITHDGRLRNANILQITLSCRRKRRFFFRDSNSVFVSRVKRQWKSLKHSDISLNYLKNVLQKS